MPATLDYGLLSRSFRSSHETVWALEEVIHADESRTVRAEHRQWDERGGLMTGGTRAS